MEKSQKIKRKKVDRQVWRGEICLILEAASQLLESSIGTPAITCSELS